MHFHLNKTAGRDMIVSWGRLPIKKCSFVNCLFEFERVTKRFIELAIYVVQLD